MDNHASIVELIKEIRENPTMYIGKYSVVRLEMFLLGWLHAHKGTVSDSNVFFDFLESVKQHYQVKVSVPGADVISLFSYDEKDALEKFFKLFEEYLEKSK